MERLDIEEEEEPRRHSISNAMVLYFLSLVFGTLMTAFSKLAVLQTDLFVMMMGRMIITGTPALVILAYTREPGFCFGPPGSVRWLLVARGFVGFLNLACQYYVLRYMNLSDYTFFNFLTPLGTAFAAHWLLNEHYVWQQAAASALSLIGVIVIARPSILFHGISDERPPALAVALQLLQVLGSVATNILLRCIGGRAHPLAAVSQFALQTFLGSAVVTCFRIRSLDGLLLSWYQWLIVILVGVFGLIYQYLMTRSLAMEKASTLSHLDYSKILMAMTWGYLLFHDIPDLISILGGGIIIAGIILSNRARSQ